MPLDARTIFTFLFVELTFENFLSVFKDQLIITLKKISDIKESNSLHSLKTKLGKKYVNLSE